jgi:hypothetical protein
MLRNTRIQDRNGDGWLIPTNGDKSTGILLKKEYPDPRTLPALHGSNHLTLSEIIPGEYVEDTEVRISSYSSSNIGRDEYLMEA